MEMMRNSQLLHLVPIVSSLLSLLLCQASATSRSDYEYGAHPRFVCTPIPVDADPSCFPTAGPGAGAPGPSGPGHQSAPPAGWWGASEEAKATILHLRESLVRQKETILDQRETIRELTAKLSLCEGFSHGVTPHDDHHGTASYSHHAGVASHHPHSDHGHHSNQQGLHGNSNFIPDSPHNPSVGGQRLDRGHNSNNNQGKDKHVTPGDITSSTEQMERMLQALKERLDNLQQKRNTSTTYSSSLKELLQRKISALEEQLHHRDHDDHSSHSDNEDHHDGDDHHADGHLSDHHDDDHGDRHHGGHDDGSNHSDHHDDGHNDDHHDADGGHDDHDDHHHHDHGDDDDDGEDDDHHSNEADNHSHFPHTGYRAPGPRPGFHSKLENVLNQLHLTGPSKKNPDAFQLSFPMRTNYMYGRLKRTLLQEIFALTLCLWMKTGGGHSMGTPFSYSAPGQSNELVLIEWGDNPLELLIDDKAVTLPLSVSDGKWHHVCVTWSTRDGHWEAYQDGVQRGSGSNLSPWRPIKPGGIFILGQEQDTLGGRFDATQSFVGEMADLHMWSHVLSAEDIYSLASCSSYLRGDVIAWSDSEVELHGGVARFPFDPCH